MLARNIVFVLAVIGTQVVLAETKHVSNADGKGWLIVRWSNGKTVPAVPQYLRVEFQKREGGRDFFEVLEGSQAGREGSVKQKGVGKSYLVDGDPREAAATLKFSRKARKLWLGESDAITAITDDSNPVPLGTHDVEIPDEVHSLGEKYLKESSYATTWFRIGHSGDRYLHTGHISAGCLTVTDVKSWTKVYEYVIKCRKDDGKSIGTVEVVE